MVNNLQNQFFFLLLIQTTHNIEPIVLGQKKVLNDQSHVFWRLLALESLCRILVVLLLLRGVFGDFFLLHGLGFLQSLGEVALGVVFEDSVLHFEDVLLVHQVLAVHPDQIELVDQNSVFLGLRLDMFLLVEVDFPLFLVGLRDSRVEEVDLVRHFLDLLFALVVELLLEDEQVVVQNVGVQFLHFQKPVFWVHRRNAVLNDATYFPQHQVLRPHFFLQFRNVQV